ncbi:DUF881 domain-containing protein [Tessaracoccus antarcticus]|uniref:DUF881 domain-containing protein n=1 Tax=Tessaracoccus antarcticus TaxID=2479848 RepID=A0A3M0G7L5_9ACTN|nr:DUF881 domain-containing protein [Tessaracoccus antarcticus]RMB60107.1 DUF881 domain-containing protein [Tessaracoccus antarcticus]
MPEQDDVEIDATPVDDPATAAHADDDVTAPNDTTARRVADEETPPKDSAERHLLRDFVRPGRGQLTVALVLFLTAVLVVLTLRSQAAQPSYANLRRTELIQLLDNLSAETRRLEDDIRDLQTTRDELASGAKGAEAAKAEATRRLDELQIIAGTVPVHGKGVRITIEDPDKKISPELLLDALEELRDAGAEVVEINDRIRVVSSTWFGLDGEGRVVADNQVVVSPIVLDVIGDPATLEAGAKFRGGLVSEVEGTRVGGTVTIQQMSRVDIDSVVVVAENEFARPN